MALARLEQFEERLQRRNRIVRLPVTRLKDRSNPMEIYNIAEFKARFHMYNARQQFTSWISSRIRLVLPSDVWHLWFLLICVYCWCWDRVSWFKRWSQWWSVCDNFQLLIVITQNIAELTVLVTIKWVFQGAQLAWNYCIYHLWFQTDLLHGRTTASFPQFPLASYHLQYMIWNASKSCSRDSSKILWESCYLFLGLSF